VQEKGGNACLTTKILSPVSVQPMKILIFRCLLKKRISIFLVSNINQSQDILSLAISPVCVCTAIIWKTHHILMEFSKWGRSFKTIVIVHHIVATAFFSDPTTLGSTRLPTR